jgi:hypothetical protein
VKGDGTNPGFLYVFPVHEDSISATPIISRPSNLLVDFGIDFLGDDHRAIIADAAYGGDIISFSQNYSVTVDAKITVANQSATCWTAYSEASNTAFLLDAGVSSITVVDPGTGGLKAPIALDAAGKGSFDAAFKGEFGYVLRGANEITVLSYEGLSKGWQVAQTFVLGSAAERVGWQGMAIWSSW